LIRPHGIGRSHNVKACFVREGVAVGQLSWVIE
jgi:hypothetical protein